MAELTSLKDALLLDVILAIASHCLWFKRYQPKSLLAPLIGGAVLSVPSAILIYPHVNSYPLAFGLAFVAFLMTVVESISLYRLSPLHHLAKYPGPWQCKLTKFWLAYVAWEGKTHEYIHSLHEMYGDIVRIGPNELSIRDADLIPNILGGSGMPKGPMWEGRRLLPSKNFNVNNSVTAVRDLARHAVLRKPWNTAFKPSSVANYEDAILARGDQFMNKLKEVSKSSLKDNLSVNIASWISFATFDFMGDIAFGGVYSLLRDGDKEVLLPKMERALFVPSVVQHVPWLQNIVLAIPGIGKDTLEFGKFGVEQAKKRFALSSSMKFKDLFYYMLEDLPPDEALPRLVSSSCLAIVAGSDTTASVLSNTIYFLLKEPQYMNRLRAELDEAFPPPDPNETITLSSLSTLPVLNAVINEVLRLQPPVPSGLQRAPALGSGGKLLHPDMYIPEGTQILVPPYSLHRNPRYFSPNPDQFWPDRWILSSQDDPNIVLDRAAFIPFSTGPANCPGKPMAMIELRYLICLLVRTFEMEFAEGYDSKRWEEGLKDRFVLVKGELPIKLRARF